MSEVTTTDEGIFLVCYVGVEAGGRAFESVRSLLEREEQRRLADEIESEFSSEIEKRYH